jgi:4-diphosphocytidyl-2-C-methyl-D-erythritol kinase
VLNVRAYAKINLTLDILGKREDGYHDIASVMQTIDVSDKLRFMSSGGIHFECNTSAIESKDNLVFRAIEILKRYSGSGEGVWVYLEKNIPMSSGLGGGSSDAACTLMALNYIWGLKLKINELKIFAADLGADVPFFLEGGTALVHGKGEDVSPLPDIEGTYFVLLVPESYVNNKTATMYANIGFSDYTNGEMSRRLTRSIEDNGKLQNALLWNAFENVADEVFPNIDTYRQAMVASGASSVRLTGAGPTIYTVTESLNRASLIESRLMGMGYCPTIAKAVPRGSFNVPG